MIAMKTNSAARTSPAAAAPSITLAQRLHALHESAQRSDHVFASPLGPFREEGAEYYVPRFVYFGPHTSQESLRVAVLSGFSRHDGVVVSALLSFVEQLARQSDIGQSLNVSIFPIANVVGLLGGAEERDLAETHWARATQPEIELLGQDARRCGYQGFIRVTTTTDDQPSARVTTVRSLTSHSSEVEIFSSADFSPWPVRFENVAVSQARTGPLTIADDLPYAPFEIELALPADWPQPLVDRMLSGVLKRLLIRYRGFLAYGQHL